MMRRATGILPLFLLLFSFPISQVDSAQLAEGPPNATTPDGKGTPPARVPIPEGIGRQCEGAYDNLPAALRIDTEKPPANEPKLPPQKELALQQGVWNFLCTRRQLLTDNDWDDALDLAKLPHETQRILRAGFVKALVASTYFDVPGYSQILIQNALIRGKLDLDHEVIRSGLSIRNSTFTGSVNMNYVRIGYDVDLAWSIFCRGIRAESARIDGSLYLGTGDSAAPGPINHPINCPIRESAEKDACGNNIGPARERREWDIDCINLSKAEITGELVISAVHMRGGADLSEIQVGRRLQIYNSFMESLTLYGANLGRFELVHTDLTNDEYSLYAAGMSVTHAVYLDRSHFAGTVSIAGSEIKSDLSIRGATFRANLDLSSARINGTLSMGTALGPASDPNAPFTSWDEQKSVLILNHTEVGIVRASLLGWPQMPVPAKEFHFSGFDSPLPPSTDGNKDNCSRKVRVIPFGSLLSNWYNSFWDFFGSADPARPPSPTLGTCYYADWLAKVDYTPSVISWLQQKLKAVGNETLANDVGILGKNHDRDDAWAAGRYLDWLALALSGLFIGYGYNAWFSGGWALLFIVIGAFVFKSTSVAKKHPHASPHKAYSPFLFSFDMLLPFIELRKEHYDLHIRENAQRYYFYFHRVMGFVLGSFLIGALSGLTK